jgi:hypothetical protein
MNTITIVILFTIIIVLMALVYHKDQIRFKNIEFKQEVIWDYIISRAELEFLQKGMGVKNSPVLVTDKTREWYKPIVNDLRTDYKKFGVKFTDRELFEIIYKKYGIWIAENVCRPYGLQNGACIIAAMAIAKE